MQYSIFVILHTHGTILTLKHHTIGFRLVEQILSAPAEEQRLDARCKAGPNNFMEGSTSPARGLLNRQARRAGMPERQAQMSSNAACAGQLLA